jgi:hypothetical protein
MAPCPGQIRVFDNLATIFSRRARRIRKQSADSRGGGGFNLNGTPMAAKVFFAIRVREAKNKKADRVSGPLLFGQGNRARWKIQSASLSISSA